MQSKTFSRYISLLIAVVSLGVIFYIFQSIAPSVQIPPIAGNSQNNSIHSSTTASQTYSTTANSTTTDNYSNYSPSNQTSDNPNTDQNSSGSYSDQNAGTAQSTASMEEASYAKTIIHAPKGTIAALIASTSDQQTLGLGDRPSLPANQGMLFPFPVADQYGFWMKDMSFPLDMVWILPNKQVAGIARDVTPDSYPEVFYPPVPISYVLEINSGSAQKFGIATGTQLEF